MLGICGGIRVYIYNCLRMADKSHYRPLSLFARNNYTLEELVFTCFPPEAAPRDWRESAKGEQVKHESHSAGSSSLQKKEETSPAMAPM